MPRVSKKSKTATRSRTKVLGVTSMKLALAFLALGFSALAAAVVVR